MATLPAHMKDWPSATAFAAQHPQEYPAIHAIGQQADGMRAFKYNAGLGVIALAAIGMAVLIGTQCSGGGAIGSATVFSLIGVSVIFFIIRDVRKTLEARRTMQEDKNLEGLKRLVSTSTERVRKEADRLNAVLDPATTASMKPEAPRLPQPVQPKGAPPPQPATAPPPRPSAPPPKAAPKEES